MQDQSAIPGPSRAIQRLSDMAPTPLPRTTLESMVRTPSPVRRLVIDYPEPPDPYDSDTITYGQLEIELDDPDLALQVAESGATTLQEVYDQLVSHSEGYSNTRNKVTTMLQKYDLSGFRSASEIQSLPYAADWYRQTDERQEEINRQKCIQILSAIPVDAIDPQLAQDAIQALIAGTALNPLLNEPMDTSELPKQEDSESLTSYSDPPGPVMDDSDVALAIAESGSVDLFETYEQLVLHCEGYSNTHNKVRAFLRKYRLDRY